MTSTSVPGLAERVVFVLVGPQHPGNVGAAARALANMGMRRLVVVAPAPSFDVEHARWMAPGADEVFDHLRIVGTLDEALEGVHRAVATTARHRKHQQRVYDPGQIATQILDDDPDRVTAILFGREDFGLSREESLRAECLLRIPTDRHASLNLGQAVLICAWELFRAASGREQGRGRLVAGRRAVRPTEALARVEADDPLADLTRLEPAVVELVGLLNRVGYTKATSPERVGVTLREAFQRARITDRQVRALRGMVHRIEYALDHPEVDWRMSRQQRALRERLTAEE